MPPPRLKGLDSISSATWKAAISIQRHVDVIVCDGFIGNVALKVSEGLVRHGEDTCSANRLESTMAGKIGYVISQVRFQPFQKAAGLFGIRRRPLLGVRGVCIICHGRSNANAIKNAIRVGRIFRGQDQPADRRRTAGWYSVRRR